MEKAVFLVENGMKIKALSVWKQDILRTAFSYMFLPLS